jgi:hypothetical protein
MRLFEETRFLDKGVSALWSHDNSGIKMAGAGIEDCGRVISRSQRPKSEAALV